MGRLVEKLHTKKDDVMQWHMQAGNIITNIKAEVDFTLSELITTNVMAWEFHVDDSTKGRYNMILGRDLIT